MKVEEAQRVLRETAYPSGDLTKPRDDLPHPVGSNIAHTLRLLGEAETLLK